MATETLEQRVTRLQSRLETAERENTELKAVRKSSGGRSTPPDGRLAAEARDQADHDPNRGFRTPREFLTCVMKAYQNPSKKLDHRLAPLSWTHIIKSLDDPELIRKAAGSDENSGINDPYGGFLVPVGFSPEVLKVDPENDPLGELTRKIPMDLPIVKMPARVDKNHTTSVSGGLTVTRRPETVAITASRMEFEQVLLTATNLAGISYATEELLTDSPQSFAAIIASGFSDQFNYHLMKERINGTGIGEYEGILNSPALVSVAKETGQLADTIVFENVVKMRSRCWGYDSAIWLANHDCYPQLAALKLVIGTAGAAMYTSSLVEGRPDLLLGRPVVYTEYADTLGDQGDLILVNPKEYLEGQYQPMQSMESIHVRFVNHERTFKFWTRNDGRGWWRTALTPVNSTATLSPFVTLDARA